MEENINSKTAVIHCFHYIITACFLISTILGCTHNKHTLQIDSDQENLVIVGDVPFIKQKDNFCGPASMASVLQFYGVDIDQDEVAKEIYIPELNGALISDMENYARKNGYNVQSTNGSIEILKENVKQNTPVILLVDRGKWKVSVPHYYVAYGYNDDKETIIIHTGYKEGQEISYDNLEREWGKMNNLMLVITP